MRFRKKPVVVEAVRWKGNNAGEVFRFCPDAECRNDPWDMWIKTLEGDHFAQVGDWIIKGVRGEFYPCKPDIFEQTYEAVDD